jgi:hypothetical protein
MLTAGTATKTKTKKIYMIYRNSKKLYGELYVFNSANGDTVFFRKKGKK